MNLSKTLLLLSLSCFSVFSTVAFSAGGPEHHHDHQFGDEVSTHVDVHDFEYRYHENERFMIGMHVVSGTADHKFELYHHGMYLLSNPEQEHTDMHHEHEEEHEEEMHATESEGHNHLSDDHTQTELNYRNTISDQWDIGYGIGIVNEEESYFTLGFSGFSKNEVFSRITLYLNDTDPGFITRMNKDHILSENAIVTLQLEVELFESSQFASVGFRFKFPIDEGVYLYTGSDFQRFVDQEDTEDASFIMLGLQFGF